jgi:hypothetical protein
VVAGLRPGVSVALAPGAVYRGGAAALGVEVETDVSPIYLVLLTVLPALITVYVYMVRAIWLAIGEPILNVIWLAFVYVAMADDRLNEEAESVGRRLGGSS